MCFLVFIFVGVFYWLVFVGGKVQYTDRRLLEHDLVEVVWTCFPAVILLCLAVPSFHLLYSMEQSSLSPVTVKVVGHQWYWSYEFGRVKLFDSYMVEGPLRLLGVDNPCLVPFGVESNFLVTRADVIHSWTVPEVEVKGDAVPGRINTLSPTFNAPGTYYGQCSEICGANHSFMPIVVESVSWEDFGLWLEA